MKAWIVCLTLGALTACSTTPIELPDCEVPVASLVVQQPLPLPELPDEVSRTANTATFNKAGMADLKLYRIAAETNFNIGVATAGALLARNQATNELISCSKMQKEWAKIREEMLEQERRDHLVDNWFHRVLIALGILVTL